jgi:hypothetical protein
LALEHIAGEKIIGFDSDLTIRREIDRVLQLHHTEVEVAMEFDNIETIKRAVEIDAGIALLPEPTVAAEVAAGTLVSVPLATDELVRPLAIIHRRGKALNNTARRFIEMLQDITPASAATHEVSPSFQEEEDHDSNGHANGQENGQHVPHHNGNGHQEGPERVQRVAAAR